MNQKRHRIRLQYDGSKLLKNGLKVMTYLTLIRESPPHHGSGVCKEHNV